MEHHKMAGAVEVLRIHRGQEVLGRRDTMEVLLHTQEQEEAAWEVLAEVLFLLRIFMLVVMVE
jgi:hypothetical protein